MNITLRQLRAFLTVAQVGSFVEASRTLHLSQSALSIVVRELEETLGFRLLDRTTRRVKLSAAGQQYHPYAERILAELRSAELCAQALQNQKVGVVRIATTQVITWTILPAVLQRYRVLFPDVRIEIIDGSVDEMLASVRSGRADIAIAMETSVDDDMEAHRVFSSRVQMVCRRDHRLARRKSVSWKDIAAESLIFIGADASRRFGSRLPPGMALNVTHEVANTSTALALVASGFGLTVCAGYVRPMTAIHHLRMIPLQGPEMIRDFMVCTSKSRPPMPVVESHRNFLIRHFESLAPGCIEDVMDLEGQTR